MAGRFRRPLDPDTVPLRAPLIFRSTGLMDCSPTPRVTDLSDGAVNLQPLGTDAGEGRATVKVALGSRKRR